MKTGSFNSGAMEIYFTEKLNGRSFIECFPSAFKFSFKRKLSHSRNVVVCSFSLHNFKLKLHLMLHNTTACTNKVNAVIVSNPFRRHKLNAN